MAESPPGSTSCDSCEATLSGNNQHHLCAACYAASYYNTACQRSHWKQHKKACKAAAAARFQSLLLGAQTGDVASMFLLAVAYGTGLGTTKNPEEAVRWYERAAAAGHVNAAFNLGACYRDGCGVAQDHATAVRWLEKAAVAGSVSAQSDLGVCYHKGTGVPRDEVIAAHWYQQAALAGFAKAQLNLGLLYVKGGAPQHAVEAAYWFQKAASDGHANAQYYLGVCYAGGRGVPRDPVQAEQWMRLLRLRVVQKL